MTTEARETTMTEQQQREQRKSLAELIGLELVHRRASITLLTEAVIAIGLNTSDGLGTYFTLKDKGLIELDNHNIPRLTAKGEAYFAELTDPALEPTRELVEEVVSHRERMGILGKQVLDSAHSGEL